MLLFGNFSIETLLAAGIVLFFGMGWHEYAHAVVANWWGDPTPRQMGRLTPNPIVHINWVGWLMFLVIGFGILGSVPINKRLMRDPRWGSFWTSFAGPLSNLAQAAIFAVLLQLMFLLLPVAFFQSTIGGFIALLAQIGIYFNALLFVFNLLPLFPLDGWHMLLALLPGDGVQWNSIPAFLRQSMPPVAAFLNKPAYKWAQWAQLTQYAFIFLLIIGFALPAQFSPFNLLIGQPTFAIYRLLTLGVF